MSIEVGDAVLKFIGDSTQLDTQFDQVGPKAKAAFEPAAEAASEFGDAAEDAGQRTAVSMREARGEVGLLGEAFGVHLPRHVRSFIAELPGEYFEAAGIMASVAVAAGAAGRGLAGAAGGGSTGTTEQLHGSVSNTTSSVGDGTNISGVQHFAKGGVVADPLLSFIGEAGREAVLPLTDAAALRDIGESIVRAGGMGGGHQVIHVRMDGGLISHENLAKVVGEINKMVNRNQVRLTASDSLRITKRSA